MTKYLVRGGYIVYDETLFLEVLIKHQPLGIIASVTNLEE